MPSLHLHGREVATIFDLLGHKENDMTYALGWCLSQVGPFLAQFYSYFGLSAVSHAPSIRLQEHKPKQGITDLEIYSPTSAFIIVEAKREFKVPSAGQLRRYVRRLTNHQDKRAKKLLVVLAQSDRKGEWLRREVPQEVGGVRVQAISWHDVMKIAGAAQEAARHAGKRLLGEFIDYLSEVSSMQDQTSNLVYVVSLSKETFGGETTFIDVVEKHRKYFHPIGGGPGGWPSDPPNYMGFRYSGMLQSIHHVEDYEIITDRGPHFPNQPSKEEKPRFLYQLGPPIRPPKPTPTGAAWRANRVWCFIDTLLTSDTIVEAKAKSDDRRARMSAYASRH